MRCYCKNLAVKGGKTAGVRTKISRTLLLLDQRCISGTQGPMLTSKMLAISQQLLWLICCRGTARRIHAPLASRFNIPPVLFHSWVSLHCTTSGDTWTEWGVKI